MPYHRCTQQVPSQFKYARIFWKRQKTPCQTRGTCGRTALPKDKNLIFLLRPFTTGLCDCLFDYLIKNGARPSCNTQSLPNCLGAEDAFPTGKSCQETWGSF